MIPLPYEILEFLFGNTIASNFNTISGAICILGIFLALLFKNRRKRKKKRKDLTQSDDWLTRAQARQEIRFQNASPPLRPTEKQQKKAKTPIKQNTTKQEQDQEPKWYPSGWVFNEETKLWEPPDYLSKQSKKKWEWDEEKRIWIDRNKKNKKDKSTK